MSRVRNILSSNVMLMLYHTLIYPYLVYRNVVWGSAKVYVLHKLLILQKKRVVRLCTGSSYRSSSSPLFSRLHLFKIKNNNKLHTALIMLKFKNNLLPTSCMNYVALADTNCTCKYATRGKNCVKSSKYRTSIRELSIAIRGPKIWDSLTSNVKDIHYWNIQNNTN